MNCDGGESVFLAAYLGPLRALDAVLLALGRWAVGAGAVALGCEAALALRRAR